VKVGEPADSDLPGFYQMQVEVSLGSESDSIIVYVSRDGRHLIRGDVLDTTQDPYAENRSKMVLDGRPFKGPSDAKVVVVDYSDFQCPHCRQLDQNLRRFISAYPQVRFVAKHFPLGQIHPWAELAHQAAECAHRLKPEAYWTVHHAIFDQQEQITTENAWPKLLEIAQTAGYQVDGFKVCMTSPETKAAVESDVREGQALRIANTPTVFVNGRRVVGGDPNVLRQFIEYELSQHSPRLTPKP
jgi:protein-disulfide isomerase